MSNDDLKAVLALHRAWVYGETKGKRADLRRADLSGADLRRADLSGAVLSDADLRRADLSDADLSGADLRGAVLRGAVLRGADLRGADLSGAVLSGAVLSGAVLRGADLRGADLPFGPVTLPDGAFTAYKACRGGVIVTLEVPTDAERVAPLTGRKCRASKVRVIALSSGEVGISIHDGVTEYRVGATVTPDSYDPDARVECSRGIHFFLTRREAEEYAR